MRKVRVLKSLVIGDILHKTSAHASICTQDALRKAEGTDLSLLSLNSIVAAELTNHNTVPNHGICFAIKSNKKKQRQANNEIATPLSDEDGITFAGEELRSVDMVQSELIIRTCDYGRKVVICKDRSATHSIP